VGQASPVGSSCPTRFDRAGLDELGERTRGDADVPTDLDEADAALFDESSRKTHRRTEQICDLVDVK
jgi:hypothetical protein